MIAHNQRTDVTYKMKVTQFTGLTQQEFEEYVLGKLDEGN